MKPVNANKKQNKYQVLCSSTPFLHYYAICVLGLTFSTQQKNAKKHYLSLSPSNVYLNIPKLCLPSDAAQHLLHPLFQKKKIL